MLTRVNEEKRHAAHSATQLAAQKRMEIDRISARLQKLLDSFLDGLVERETFTAEKAKLMSQKKTLEEQKNHLMTGRADWLEPFQNWISAARNAGEIALRGSPQEKKVLAHKVFGSNLVLDRKKARGSCLKPWSLLVENSPSGGVVRERGLEPTNRPFSCVPVRGVSLPFIAPRYTRITLCLRAFSCIHGQQSAEKFVQFLCKSSECAKVVQSQNVAPKSVQKLCKFPLGQNGWQKSTGNII